MEKVMSMTRYWRWTMVVVTTVIMGMVWVACHPLLGTVEFYSSKLRDSGFVWRGTTANLDRIPSLHAARALAYIGDDAVPFLFEAVSDTSVDIYSVYDALYEIGLPVQEFRDEIIVDRDIKGIQAWWNLNNESSRRDRSRFRKMIGLPVL